MSISTRAAVDAARRVGADLGFSGSDPVVLHDGSNVVVHLRPESVVARVASRTALIRLGVEAWLSRDIAVARHVAARGVAGPRHVEGAVVALDVLERSATAGTVAELRDRVAPPAEEPRSLPGESHVQHQRVPHSQHLSWRFVTAEICHEPPAQVSGRATRGA